MNEPKKYSPAKRHDQTNAPHYIMLGKILFLDFISCLLFPIHSAILQPPPPPPPYPSRDSRAPVGTIKCISSPSVFGFASKYLRSAVLSKPMAMCLRCAFNRRRKKSILLWKSEQRDRLHLNEWTSFVILKPATGSATPVQTARCRAIFAFTSHVGSCVFLLWVSSNFRLLCFSFSFFFLHLDFFGFGMSWALPAFTSPTGLLDVSCNASRFLFFLFFLCLNFKNWQTRRKTQKHCSVLWKSININIS